MLSHIKIKGSPFNVGLALGRFGQRAVHEHLRQSPAWASLMPWSVQPCLTAMADGVAQRYPRYWQELQGLAEGLALPLMEVFTWNCRGDLLAMAPDGCTTVQLPGRPYPAFAHNEDGAPGLAGTCALAEISEDDGIPFTAFVYPGSLPGHTFAVTARGLAVTVNNLRPLGLSVPGTPRMLLTRAILDQPTLAAAIDSVRASPRAGGFHLTLGQVGQQELLSVEFNAALCSVITLENPALHANHMIHPAMHEQAQRITRSSDCRQQRGQLLLNAARQNGVDPEPLAILFDQNDAAFPIFRDAPDDSDQENTLATAVLQIGAEAVTWQVYGARSSQPLFCLRNAMLQSAPGR